MFDPEAICPPAVIGHAVYRPAGLHTVQIRAMGTGRTYNALLQCFLAEFSERGFTMPKVSFRPKLITKKKKAK